MKTINISCLVSFSIGIGIITNAFAGGDPAIGKSKAIICIGCHGVDGNNDNPEYPVLAGQGEAYIIKQLTDFKTGARVEEHMSAMVEALSLSDIPHIASYFALQKRKATQLTKAITDADKGKFIYHNGSPAKSVTACVACHALDGSGNTAARFPALNGQHAAYISKMLKEFRNNKRHNDPDKMMRNIAANLNDEEIEDIAAYISRLNQQ